MPDPLIGAWKKVERAYQHINQLDADIKAFVTSKPYGVRTDYDAERGEVVIRFANVPELPLDFSITIGEALYQMRSALDLLGMAVDRCQWSDAASQERLPDLHSSQWLRRQKASHDKRRRHGSGGTH